LVGLGFGAEFIPLYQKHPDAECYAICQRDKGKLNKVGDLFKVERRFTRFEDLLKTKEIDAIHVVTPIAAHAIALSWTRVYHLFDVHPTHGQFVAFSLLTQLMMEGTKPEILNKVYGFCKSVGLPTTFEKLGLKKATDEAIRMVAEDASKIVLITSMPRASKTPNSDGAFYDADEILNCLKAADAYGRAF